MKILERHVSSDEKLVIEVGETKDGAMHPLLGQQYNDVEWYSNVKTNEVVGCQ